MRKSWTFRIALVSSSEAIAHPTRQPVTEYVFDKLLMVTVRSLMPSKDASGMCLAPL